MHVGENYKAQLLSHIKCINSKIVLQLGNWDESIELKEEYTPLIIWVSIDTYLWIGLTFLSTISLPCVASELPYAMAKLDIGSERMDWPGNPDICGTAWFLLSRWQLQTEKTGECTAKDKAYTCNLCLSCKKSLITHEINFRRMQTLPSRTYPIYDPATAPLVSSNSSLPSGLSRGGFLRRRFGSEFKKKRSSRCVLDGEIWQMPVT